MFVVVERRNGVRSDDDPKLDKDCFQMEVPIELSGSDGEEQVSTVIDESNPGSNEAFVDSPDESNLAKQSSSVNRIDSSHDDQNDEVCENSSFSLASRASVHVTGTNTTNVKFIRVVPLPHARSEVWSYFGFIADNSGEIHDKRKTICKLCMTTLSYSGNTTNLFTHLKAIHPEVTPQKINPALRPQQQRSTPIKTIRKRKHTEENDSSQCITILPIESPKNSSTNSVFNKSSVQCTTAPAYESEVDVVAHKSNGTEVNSSSHHNNSLAQGISKFKADEEHQTISSAREEEITNALANFIAKDCRPLGIVSGRGFEDFLHTLVPGYKIPDMAKLEPLVRKKYHDIRYNLFIRSIDSDSDILM